MSQHIIVDYEKRNGMGGILEDLKEIILVPISQSIVYDKDHLILWFKNK